MLDSKSVHVEALDFDVATVAFKGARNNQEDSLVSSFPLGQRTGFAVLADGMGGHNSGSLASTLVMSETFAQLKMKEKLLEEGNVNIPATLQDAAEAANKRVTDHIESHDETYGMGSTLLATVIRRDKLYWVSIGDSPLLLFRHGALRQLNKDHSMAPQIDMMVKTGAMSEEVGRDHPDRNTLTSAISGGKIERIDCPTRPIALLPDDIVIAASDGLQFLSNSVIARTLKRAQNDKAVDIANALLNEVRQLEDPDQDNTAIVVIKLSAGSEQSDAIDADDLPVLATADDEEDTVEVTAIQPTKRTVKLVQSNTISLEGTSGDMEDVQPEILSDITPISPKRENLWYRGQTTAAD